MSFFSLSIAHNIFFSSVVFLFLECLIILKTEKTHKNKLSLFQIYIISLISSPLIARVKIYSIRRQENNKTFFKYDHLEEQEKTKKKSKETNT